MPNTIFRYTAVYIYIYIACYHIASKSNQLKTTTNNKNNVDSCLKQIGKHITNSKQLILQ